MFHHKLSIILTLLFGLVLSTSASPSPQQCRASLDTCTEMVQPYLSNAAYMFPTSLEAVNEMCKMWSTFVDCIRKYISACFEENRRILFHKSVENSIDTVHAICSSKVYQNEYLKKATCFKQVSMDYCGRNYRTLIDVISNRNANDEHICCAYAQFKQCVNRPLLEDCGRKAKNLMDHSMSFLISRCNHYSYQVRTECPRPETFELKSRENDQDDDGVELIVSRTSEGSEVLKVSPKPDEIDVVDPKLSTSTVASMDTTTSITTTMSPTTTTTIGSTTSQQKRSSPPVTEEEATKPLEKDPVDGSDSETIVYTLRPESQISTASGSASIYLRSLVLPLLTQMFSLYLVRLLC